MQDTFARATHSACSAGRPSAARDDRVSCIQGRLAFRPSALTSKGILHTTLTLALILTLSKKLKSGYGIIIIDKVLNNTQIELEQIDKSTLIEILKMLYG